MNLFASSKLPAVAIIDVSESGVQGALIDPGQSGEEGIFIHINNTRTTLEGLFSSITELEQAVTAVINDLADRAHRGLTKGDGLTEFYIERCVFMIDSPYQYSYLSKTTHKENTSFRITKELIDDILSKEIAKIDDAPDLILQKKDSIEFIKKEVTSVCLNGYPAKKPYGIEAKELDISLFNSVAPAELLESLRSQIKKTVGSTPVYFFPKNDAVTDLIRRSNEKGLKKYVNVNTSETLITLIENDVVKEHLHIHHGYSKILEEIEKKFEVPRCVALSYVSMYFSEECEKGFLKKLENTISSIMQFWELEYEKNMNWIPDIVYFNSNQRIEMAFKNVLIKKHPETEIRPLHEYLSEIVKYDFDESDMEMIICGLFVNRKINSDKGTE